MQTLHPSCIHMLPWSLKRSVERTWTGSPFYTNESAWSAMVMGSQSEVALIMEVQILLILSIENITYSKDTPF